MTILTYRYEFEKKYAITDTSYSSAYIQDHGSTTLFFSHHEMNKVNRKKKWKL